MAQARAREVRDGLAFCALFFVPLCLFGRGGGEGRVRCSAIVVIVQRGHAFVDFSCSVSSSIYAGTSVFLSCLVAQSNPLPAGAACRLFVLVGVESRIGAAEVWGQNVTTFFKGLCSSFAVSRAYDSWVATFSRSRRAVDPVTIAQSELGAF